MEKSGFKGGARRRHGLRLALGRSEKVHDRFGDAEKHDADAHAGREKHGEPNGEAERGTSVIGAESDRAEARHGDERHGAENDRHGENVEPGKFGGDEVLRRREESRHGVRKDARETDAEEDEEDGGPEDAAPNHETAFRAAARNGRGRTKGRNTGIRQKKLLEKGRPTEAPGECVSSSLRSEPVRQKTGRGMKGMSGLV